MSSSNLIARFRGWALGALAIGALLYVGGSVWAGLPAMRDQLQRFQWPLAVPILMLTLLNYGLRFGKWQSNQTFKSAFRNRAQERPG